MEDQLMKNPGELMEQSIGQKNGLKDMEANMEKSMGTQTEVGVDRCGGSGNIGDERSI